MKREALALTLIIALVISVVAGLWFMKTYFSKTLIVPDDYSTIQAAIDNASAGDTVFVKKGTYYVDGPKGITISKPLSLVGEDSQKTIIKKEAYAYRGSSSTILIYSDHVTVTGFTINVNRNGDVGIYLEYDYQHGQHVPSSCKIIGNNILNNSRAGILTRGGSKENYIVSNNITDNGSHGISMASSDSGIIGNTIERNTGGINVNSAKNVIIKQNNIVHNELGGLTLRWYGPFHVYQNNIADNNGYGMKIAENCGNSMIHDNNIARNQIGIVLLNFDAPFGVDNSVYNNNLINNSVNAFVEHTYYIPNRSPVNNGTDVVAWDKRFVGNYWSDYEGQGTYVIDENNIDHYPLMQPVDISGISTIIAVAVIVTVVVAVFIGLIFHLKKRKH